MGQGPRLSSMLGDDPKKCMEEEGNETGEGESQQGVG